MDKLTIWNIVNTKKTKMKLSIDKEIEKFRVR